MPKDKEQPSLPRSALCFKAHQFSLQPPPAEGQPRKFKGTAYSGEVIEGHSYWGNVIFDLDSMQIATPLAALLEHNSESRVGVIQSFNNDHQNGLTVEGSFLSNDKAQQIIQDSDGGFPFQMSVHIEPGSVEQVEKGEVVVNGRTIKAPCVVFRNGVIREVSFCALGADSNTNAVAASHQPKQINQEDTNVTELELAKEAQKQAETERDQLKQELQQFKAQKRADEIAQLEKDVGKQFSADDKTAYTNMDDSTFTFSVKQVRQFSAKPEPVEQKTTLPGYLFEHQAKGGAQEQNQFSGKPKSLADMAKDRGLGL